jgi:hypothetical protein
MSTELFLVTKSNMLYMKMYVSYDNISVIYSWIGKALEKVVEEIKRQSYVQCVSVIFLNMVFIFLPFFIVWYSVLAVNVVISSKPRKQIF